MATINKDFKVKHGLIVEGATATVNNFDVLTKSTEDQNYVIGLIGGSATSDATADTVVLRDENADFSANMITSDLTGDVTGTVSDISNHDTDDLTEGTTNKYYSTTQAKTDAAALLTSATLENITITGDETGLTITAENGVADSDTDDLDEGVTNLYYTDARARDAVSAGSGLDYNSTSGEFSADLGNGLQFDGTGQIEIDENVVATQTDLSTDIGAHSDLTTGVHGVTGDVVGTSDVQILTNKELGTGTTLSADIDAAGNTVTDLATPVNASDAATKGYVDAVAEGLHIHASVAALSDSNISLPTAPAAVDGVTLSVNDRVLLVGQTAPAENGIYVVINGDLARAADYNTAEEIQAGDFVFVSGGTVYGSTGWVQENNVATLGTDPIEWDQFSGAGTFTAGNGLTLTGTEFAIDTDVTATKTHVDDMIDDHSDLTTGVHGVTGDVVGTSDTQTLTDKTLGSGTVLGADLDGTNTYKVVNLVDPTSNQDAATKKYVDDEITSVSGAIDDLTTTDVVEGDNLYFTDTRAKTSAANLLTGASLTNIVITGDETGLTITAENGVADSTTDDLAEGATNKYFTDQRVVDAVIADVDTDDVTEGTSNLYFTDARAVDALEAVTPNFVEIDINSVATQIAATTTVATASTVTAHSFLKASYRSAEYLVKVAHGTHTEISKVLLTLDTSDNIAITEYAIVGTNGSASTISADVSGDDVRLRVATNNNSSEVTVVGTLVV
jgi:hypothetical protein